MIKNGLRFKVTREQDVYGQIDGETTKGIWSVVFEDKGGIYARYDVHESTIKYNLEHGIYTAIEN